MLALFQLHTEKTIVLEYSTLWVLENYNISSTFIQFQGNCSTQVRSIGTREIIYLEDVHKLRLGHSPMFITLSLSEIIRHVVIIESRRRLPKDQFMHYTILYSPLQDLKSFLSSGKAHISSGSSHSFDTSTCVEITHILSHLGRGICHDFLTFCFPTSL